MSEINIEEISKKNLELLDTIKKLRTDLRRIASESYRGCHTNSCLCCGEVNEIAVHAIKPPKKKS